MDVVTLGMAKADAKKKYDTDGQAQKLIQAHAALAQRTSTPVDIVVLGDSIVEGTGATDPETKFASMFVNALRARYPTPGVLGGKGYVMVHNSSASTYGLDQVTFTGNATLGPWGLGKRAYKVDATTGSGAGMIRFPNRTTATSVEFHFRTETANAQIEYSLDDGATYVPVATAAQGERKLRVALASRSAVAIRVRYLAGGATHVQGIVYFDGDENAGIRLWPAGVSGSRTEQFLAVAGGSDMWSLQLTKIAPALVIVEWLTNDMMLRTPAQYKTDMLALITLIRNAKPNVPIMFAPPWRRPNSATVGLAPWESYVSVLKEIAATDANMLYFDTSARKPTDADTLGLLLDGLHPNTKGHALLGDHYARALIQ